MKPRDYELVMVLSPHLDQEGVASALERVTRFISGKGGEVAAQEQWGMRRLSYTIKKFTEGNYILSQLRLEPDAARELEENLRVSEEVIRHLLVRKEPAKP